MLRLNYYQRRYWIFIFKYSGKSVGEDIDVKLACPDDGETEVDVSISLDDIKVQKPEVTQIKSNLITI